MLNGYRRLPLGSVGASAAFYSDTLFLELPESTLRRIPRGSAPSTRSRSAAALRSYAHEMVHFHQFAGTQCGYVLRLLLAARMRLRFLAIKMMPGSSVARLQECRTIRGPLLRWRPDARPDVAPELRDAVDDAALQLILWLDAAERFIIVPGGMEQRLFASGPDVLGPLLSAAHEIAHQLPDVDLDGLLDPVASAGAAAMQMDAPLWDEPVPLAAILEGPAVVNQAAFMMKHPRLRKRLAGEWQRAPNYNFLVRAVMRDLPGDDYRSWTVHGAVALLADLALDGWLPPSSKGQRSWTTPRHALAAALRISMPWREIMDRPLGLWSAEEIRQKRERLDGAFDASVEYGNKPHSPGLQAAAPASPPSAQPPRDTMMALFQTIRSRSLLARRLEPVATLLPGEAVFVAPDRLEQGEALDAMACPFLLVGGRAYQVAIEDDVFTKWRMMAVMEQGLHAFFTESHFVTQGMPEDSLAAYRDVLVRRAPFLEPCL